MAQPDGSAKITAQANSGQGTLYVDGGLSWFGDAQPLQLKIHGENVLLSNTSELRIVANPNLDFTLAKAAMELRGTVHVPEADIDRSARTVAPRCPKTWSCWIRLIRKSRAPRRWTWT